MNYPHVLKTIYGEPWLITPQMHAALRTLIATRLDSDTSISDIKIEPVMSVPDALAGAYVLPVFGVLGKHLSMFEESCGGCSVDRVSSQLDFANSQTGIDRVILYINSPGGQVTGIPELGDKIANNPKPVFGFSDSECCSGGYWLASQTKGFYVTRSSISGSVGVYRLFVDETQALEMDGIKVTAVSAGKFKLMGAPFKALTDDELALSKESVAKIYAEFKSAITSRRSVADEYMEGQVFDGEDAVKYGLADGIIDNLEAVITLTQQNKQ